MVAKSERSRSTAKVAAITVGALVVGIGGVFTLASWNDSEWVSGLTEGGLPGIGTSAFEVQQNANPDFAAGTWADYESNPGDALTFTMNPTALTPGDTITAPVSLQTTAESVAGNVTLQAAEDAAGFTSDEVLWSALDVSVFTAEGAERPTCDASILVDPGSWTEITEITSLDTPATTEQPLAAESGSTQHYCFALTLPDTEANQTNPALQGVSVAPAWEFFSESVEQ